MTYEEFEWHILRLVYEEGLDRLQPSYLAYALGLPHDKVSEFLEEGARSGLLELDVMDDGRLEYAIPGLDRADDLPAPIWKDIEEQFNLERPADAAQDDTSPPASSVPDGVGAEPPQNASQPPPGLNPPPATPSSEDAADGSTQMIPHPQATPAHHTPPSPAARHRLAVAQHPQLPESLREHIRARYSHSDGSMIRLESSSPIVGTDVSVDDPTSRAMVALDSDEHFPFRVEASDDTYCDPTQTVFMRQIRVHGVESEQELRHHVQRLFESFGYRIVQAEEQRLRFERGSVTFILALVPLFVLVLPLFVYLFLYCMGRSTIHQEPVELDVQFRKHIEDGEPVYEIDLTFIGLHGVVLGAADQRVLNQEIDTLRDELRWSLSPG